MDESEIQRRRHLHKTYLRPTPSQCPTCGKTRASFSSAANLRRHILAHTGLKPFECPQCGKGFAQSANLQTHIRIHTKEKPFKCPICSRDFSQSSHMKRHVHAVHMKPKPYHYECQSCSNKYSNPSSLKLHMMRAHTNAGEREERQSRCSMCSKFCHLESHNSNSSGSRRFHSSEAPYHCIECGLQGLKFQLIIV